MARLASETKMGFYATSIKTIKKILDKTVEIQENTFALDSCCGEGDVIEFFKIEYGCYNFAVELDEERARIASKRQINKVLNADSLNNVRKANRWVGFNFLNPPYDYSADGERLELKFIDTWGLTTIEGGIMMLVINPSSANSVMAKRLILQGYKPIHCIYDPENEDFKKFGQFFLILKRVRENFRCDLDRFMKIFENPIAIDDVEVDEKIKAKQGMPPRLFKEINIPQWKLQELLGNSTLKKHFLDGLRNASLNGGSIEIPNEGQAAILIASGKLNKRITLISGEEVILKGTVKKERIDKANVNEDGEVTQVKRVDSYKTVVYCLNLTRGCFEQLN